jgi:hypothetical protein
MENERHKSRRISAGQGMTTMSNEMGSAIDSLKEVITGATQCTAHSEAREIESRVVDAIEKDEGLSDDDFAIATLAVASNPTLANIYLCTKSRSARRHFLLLNMEKYKKEN